ncbi:MAG: hypothetical protein R2857_00565 [Vampirovibrionales bacterium]
MTPPKANHLIPLYVLALLGVVAMLSVSPAPGHAEPGCKIRKPSTTLGTCRPLNTAPTAPTNGPSNPGEAKPTTGTPTTPTANPSGEPAAMAEKASNPTTSP